MPGQPGLGYSTDENTLGLGKLLRRNGRDDGGRIPVAHTHACAPADRTRSVDLRGAAGGHDPRIWNCLNFGRVA